MNYIFIDFEMNPVAKHLKKEMNVPSYLSREIIEIGAVVLDETYEKTREFRSYIKPEYNLKIAAPIEKLTGISTDMVADAADFADGIREFEQWCNESDEYVVYAWSECDLDQLLDEAEAKNVCLSEKLTENWLDFQEEFGDFLGMKKQLSLSNAVSLAGCVFSGRQHDALSDALNTSELFRKAKADENFGRQAEKIRKALAPAEPLTASIGDMLKAKLAQKNKAALNTI